MKTDRKWLMGVDEAGRGPLAGPVSVGVALVTQDFNWDTIPGVGDSKKVSPKNREIIFLQAKKLKKEGELDFAVCLVSAKEIDEIGIVPSIQKAMNQALKKIHKSGLCNPSSRQGLELGFNEVLVRLDGGLKAPKEYMHQETIIKGDSKEKVIGLASIVAKVTRDRYMVGKSAEALFAMYGFDLHKGYGTKVHRELIQKHGISSLHRSSFCKKVGYAK